MSAPKPHIARARTSLAVGTRVLFVEGKEDATLYAKWLEKIDPSYRSRVELLQTNGRNDLNEALPTLGNHPNAFALRDRDELNAARIATLQAAIPQLMVNERRHCLESYFCDPDEIVNALVAKDAAKYGPAEPTLRMALATSLPDWVDHWAMWTTTLQLQGDMVSVGYCSYFHKVVPLPSDAEIQAQLALWGQLADPITVWNSFATLRATARASPVAEKHRGCVHGKEYWSKVVVPALRVVENRSDWLVDLAEWSPVPADLDPLLRTVLA